MSGAGDKGAAQVGLADLERLHFAKGDGLLPSIVQHAVTGAVLMLGYMNRQALSETLTRRRVVFFSRSKQRLWEKGETSGHRLELAQILADCDCDTLLVTAWPRGPACHLGTATCFGDEALTAAERLAFLAALEAIIAQRLAERPEGSGPPLGLRGLRVAPARVQRIGDQVPGRRLRAGICGGERQRLAAHGLGLRRVVLGKPHPPELDPQQRIARLDAQCALERRGRLTVLAAAGLGARLRHQRAGRRAEVKLPRRARRGLLRRRRHGLTGDRRLGLCRAGG